ncbi:hypothetical protein SAMN06297144_0433 [Sphingomonas guangdongensis]|uniref:Lipoprotein n=1 Tax=Sphingomonas guangdongensis TaxID=1141890 RepID=A0A285QBE7_9SPHN|nr:hypothetical protein [Sphingomonas guangdongensis]SOB79213.1 hypothetical protein SAMN06297144_0433 [Sphingomonas guangdongensis]
MRRLAPALVLLLGSCSQWTDVSARFIGARLAFVAVSGNAVDCVHTLAVIDANTREEMWAIGRAATGDCIASLPIWYGQSAGPVVRKRPLVPGRRYEIEGSGAGGNHLSGRFVITPLAGWRITDVPNPPLNDTADNSQ